MVVSAKCEEGTPVDRAVRIAIPTEKKNHLLIKSVS